MELDKRVLPLTRGQLANVPLCVGRPCRAENGAVVALRRRASMVLRGRQPGAGVVCGPFIVATFGIG
jgi:hypothetical protein